MAGLWHEQRVRERAYQIWETAGRPDGCAIEHWLQAEAEISADERALDAEIELEKEGVV